MSDGLCNNCGTRILGPYCHECGQKEADEWRSVGAILHQFWDEAVSLDFKSARSLAGLLRPGYLSAEFIAGRRARYLGPLKIYFLCAALFFLVAPWIAGFSVERLLASDPDGTFRSAIDRRMAVTGMRPDVFAEHYTSNSKTVYTLSPILSVLAMTLLLRAFYRKACARLGPHAVFAVHYIAFFYLAAIATGALNQALSPGPFVVLVAMQGTLAAYLFAGLRRVYREPAPRTAGKTVAIIVLAFAIDSPINIAAKMLTIAMT